MDGKKLNVEELRKMKERIWDEKHYKMDFLLEQHGGNLELMRTFTHLFGKFRHVERQMGMDILDMNFNEIAHCLSFISYKFRDNLSAQKTRVTEYFRYYGKEEMLTDLSIQAWESICTRGEAVLWHYNDVKELEMTLNEHLENAWYYNAVIYGCFYGFQTTHMEDFIELRASDIDFAGNQIIFCSGRVMDMSDKPELAYYLKKVTDYDCQYSMSKSTQTYSGKYTDSVFKCQENNRIRRSSTKEGALARSISSGCFRQIKSYADRDISVKILGLSGLLHHLMRTIGAEELKDYIEDRSKMYLVQEEIAAFGSNMTASALKYKLADYIRQEW